MSVTGINDQGLYFDETQNVPKRKCKFANNTRRVMTN